jgi:hypothetical protein
MVATYLVGPAYGWQHVRLCASTSSAAYHPTLGERADHPADEARLRDMVAVLTHMGATETGARITSLWNSYLDASRKSRPQDYEVCYPQTLLESLAKNVIAGCRSLGVRGFDQPAEGPPSHVPALLAEAWDRFLADAQPIPTGSTRRLRLFGRSLALLRHEAELTSFCTNDWQQVCRENVLCLLQRSLQLAILVLQPSSTMSLPLIHEHDGAGRREGMTHTPGRYKEPGRWE